MKKISYSLVLVVIVGIALSVFWAYDRYFKKEDTGVISFIVDRGDVNEVVLVRGEVVPQKDFDLEFPFSGTVSNVWIKEGRSVSFGTPMVKLNTIDFELELDKLEAVLVQAQANLEKLIAGATEEDIKISEVKVQNAGTALQDAKKNLVNNLQDAYVRSDDAVRNNADQLFSNPRGSNPQISVIAFDSQLKLDIETRRLVVKKILNTWKTSLGGLSVESDFPVFVNETNRKLDQIREFLDRIALMVNSLTADSSLTQTTIDGYRSDISTARTNINTAITNTASAEEKLRTTESSLSLALQELELKVSGAREEDIAIAQAKVKETESGKAIVREKIRKSTIYAPGFVTVEKVWLEKGEIFRPGTTVISLSTPGFKIQADLSELEIGKVGDGNGNDVLIEFDAFPKKLYTGKVVSIEPRKVVKDGDTYYKINIFFDTEKSSIRSGMSTDITINISSKKNVIRIPEVAIIQKENKDFVTVLADGIEVLREIETGISDGEYVEIISGVSEREIIIISAN